MQKIIFASLNAGKVQEVRKFFANLPVTIVSQAELNIDSIEETGKTFVENAILKARHIASKVDYPVLADDSGFVVDCLDGEPGVVSARYAGDNATDKDNRRKLIAKLKNKNRTKAKASGHCAMVLMRSKHDPVPVISEGIWDGFVIDHCIGEYGFGYEPMFYIPSMGCTAAELSRNDKNSISHRGQAMKKISKSIISLY